METRDVCLVLRSVQQLPSIPQNGETQQQLAWQAWNICGNGRMNLHLTLSNASLVWRGWEGESKFTALLKQYQQY